MTKYVILAGHNEHGREVQQLLGWKLFQESREAKEDINDWFPDDITGVKKIGNIYMTGDVSHLHDAYAPYDGW